MNEQQSPPTAEQALNFLYSATEVANTMNNEIQKLDGTTLRVIRATPVATDYTRDYLESQRALLIEQRDRDYASRNESIAYFDNLIAQCESLGVQCTATPEEPAQ